MNLDVSRRYHRFCLTCTLVATSWMVGVDPGEGIFVSVLCLMTTTLVMEDVLVGTGNTNMESRVAVVDGHGQHVCCQGGETGHAPDR